MAESAYHNEALRRQRAIERKNEAQRRLLNGPQSNEAHLEGHPDYKDPILYSGPGHYEQNREVNNPIDCQDEKDIPGKAQLKTPKPLPESLRNVERDSVYKILHPYDFH